MSLLSDMEYAHKEIQRHKIRILLELSEPKGFGSLVNVGTLTEERYSNLALGSLIGQGKAIIVDGGNGMMVYTAAQYLERMVKEES